MFFCFLKIKNSFLTSASKLSLKKTLKKLILREKINFFEKQTNRVLIQFQLILVIINSTHEETDYLPNYTNNFLKFNFQHIGNKEHAFP